MTRNRFRDLSRQDTPPEDQTSLTLENNEDFPDLKNSEKVLPEPNKKIVGITFASLLLLSMLFYVDFNTGHVPGDLLTSSSQRELYHEMHQKKFIRENNITFYSNYESGNLLFIHEKSKNGSHFYLGIAEDCCQENRTKPNFWFNFEVEGLHMGLHTFTIANIGYSRKVFEDGIVPVYKRSTEKQWKYVQEFPIKLHKVEKEATMALSFKHMFLGSKEKVRFAFSFPWTFEDNNNWILELITSSQGLYFHTEILCYNSAGAPIEIIQISNFKGILKKKLFKGKDGLFPEKDEVRANLFKGKKYVIVTARSRAFGTPSSYVVKGLVEAFIHDKELGRKFFDTYVLVIVPMLNPDGADKGQNFRMSDGTDFEEFYKDVEISGNKKEKVGKNENSVVNVAQKLSLYFEMIQEKAPIYAYIDLITEIEEENPQIIVKNFTHHNKFGALCIPYLLHLHHKRWQLSDIKLLTASKTYKNRTNFFKNIASEKAYIISVNFWGKQLTPKDKKKVFIGDRRYIRGFKGRYNIDYFLKFGRDISRVLVDSDLILHQNSQEKDKAQILAKAVESEIKKIDLLGK